MNKIEYKELMTFHPGYYVKEIIDDMNITQSEFAKRLDLNDKNISKLVNGEIPLSNDVACKLSKMFGISPSVWLHMQLTYDTKVLEIKERKEIDQEKEYIKQIDYKFFVALGLVPAVRDADEKIRELLKFLKISSLKILNTRDFLVNYRSVVSEVTDKNIINSNAWVQTALNVANGINCNAFDRKKLESHLPEIRNMTLQKPSVFLPRLKEIFSECGVAFVLLPHLKNSGVNGAVKWIDKNKVLLAINNRGLTADKFWFSLFHEIGHIFQERLKEIFISGGNASDLKENNLKFENDADTFSQTYLIPQKEYEKFINKSNFSARGVIAFSESIEMHPGVVVGRLQHDKYIGFDQLTNLKEKYIISLSN